MDASLVDLTLEAAKTRLAPKHVAAASSVGRVVWLVYIFGCAARRVLLTFFAAVRFFPASRGQLWPQHARFILLTLSRKETSFPEEFRLHDAG